MNEREKRLERIEDLLQRERPGRGVITIFRAAGAGMDSIAERIAQAHALGYSRILIVEFRRLADLPLPPIDD